MSGVGIFVPAYRGQVCAELINSILADFDWAARAGVKVAFFWHDIQPVDRARNLAVDRALTMGLNYLMMYDADCYCDPRGSALGHMYGVLRGWQGERPAAAVTAATVCRGGDLVNVSPVRVDEVYEAEKAGAAVLLLDLVALGDLGDPPWFRYELAPDGIDPVAGEDVYFTNRVRELGGTVLVDYQIPTRHISQIPLNLERFHVPVDGDE